MAKLKITQTRSIIKCKDNQIATLKALGLKKIGSVVEQEDNADIRGMINVVDHLVKVEEIG
ncbi:MAG TPA: 50S ribosomal protein L30 [Clostridiales bacterium]|nr:50S ribosomal protein L30 [Clostridiales bacterium]